MADWATISSLATAGGTLVLAAATFAAVRSSNRSARLAERSLLLGLRPVLIGSRNDDPPEKVRWGDEHAAAVRGGTASIEIEGGVIYLAVALRNVGAGLAVLQGWNVTVGRATTTAPHPGVEEFRRQQRDLYIAPSDTGFWQAAVRDPEERLAKDLTAAIAGRQELTTYLLYGDHEGGQLTISRFGVRPIPDDGWVAEIGRHWTLDTPDPRLRPE